MRRRHFKSRRNQLAEHLARSLPRPLRRLADRWLEHREIRRILMGAEEAKKREKPTPLTGPWWDWEK
ncbi:MAG: hypothetical protein V3T74_11745 [Gemmatimonadales bacterium]